MYTVDTSGATSYTQKYVSLTKADSNATWRLAADSQSACKVTECSINGPDDNRDATTDYERVTGQNSDTITFNAFYTSARVGQVIQTGLIDRAGNFQAYTIYMDDCTNFDD